MNPCYMQLVIQLTEIMYETRYSALITMRFTVLHVLLVEFSINPLLFPGCEKIQFVEFEHVSVLLY